MARDSINNSIDNFKKTYNNNSSDELTLEQAREQLRNENARKANERAKKYIQEQVALEDELKKRGVQKSSAEWLKAMRYNQKLLEKEREKAALESLDEQYAYATRLEEQLAATRYKLNEDILKSEAASREEKLKAFNENLAANFQKGLNNAANQAINVLTSGLDGIMSSYAQHQAKINARIQGAGKNYLTMEKLMSTAIGVQPYVKNQAMVENLATLVDTGIAYNVELRAFIQTVSENIATTFSATNGTLMRLIRLQQSDSTAARLGLEASLTRFFNGMYQNTEYLSNAFDNVSAALLEASSTMSNDKSIQFEYQVQKWLGSLYAIGMSDATVSGLAQALGYLGSGNVNALSGSQYQNLLVMAAGRAGLSYGDLLIGGLDSATTNVLLESIVTYLQEIAGNTNQVVKSELGRTFGVTMSDLQSALNLNTTELKQLAGKSMNYNSSMAELYAQMSLLPGRMSMATMMDNMWSNLMWGLGSNIAANPMLYSIWKVTDMIQSYTGGINLPAVFAMGNGFNLNTTVENLVKLGVVGISSLGMIGDLISGLSSTAAPATMLLKMGLAQDASNSISKIGRGLNTVTSGISSSSTVVAGNSSGEDIYSSTKQGASDEAQAEADAQKSDKDMTEMTDLIQQDVNAIYKILESIAGTGGLKVISADAGSYFPH